MKFSVLQMNTRSEKSANLEQADMLAAHAVETDRPDIVVLPEVFAFMGGSVADKWAAAEELPEIGESGGEAYETLRGIARSHGVFVHGGSFVERDGDNHFNTTIAFDRSGGELARYRKIHLFDVSTPDGREYRESDTFGAGREIVTYDAGNVRVGCSICYDLRFAELYRALAEAGANVIMVPAAFTLQTGKDHWEVLLRARAIETQTYVVAAAQTGTHQEGNDERASWGHSMIVDPWGHILAQAREGAGHATAHVEIDYLDQVRTRIPVARHRVL
ncbi:MAG: carbon-nitrogen hydrolase [Alphaproteobacteria bacterium]|nr:carbon-nitrogen hydrolase [Alphaproteobacteria bacterium]|tara:strand:- start:1761 stop:2585 length:825 start_codon:yes stop_codon:yes gene_type:complete